MKKEHGNTIHGLSKTSLYHRWLNIIYRCYNQKYNQYEDYGGRGIKVRDEWRYDFKAFYDYMMSLDNAMRPELSIDRIDNNGNYEPGNIRWVDRSTQKINSRIYKSNKSGYRGVSWDKKYCKWRADAKYRDKQKCLGWYDNPKKASIARNKYIYSKQQAI